MSFLTSCISTTTLKTKDADTQIYTETSTEPGHGKLNYQDRQWLFGSVDVRVEKKNCQTLHYKIRRSDEFAPEGFFLGVISYGLGFLWMGKYLNSYDINYQCTASKEAGVH